MRGEKVGQVVLVTLNKYTFAFFKHQYKINDNKTNLYKHVIYYTMIVYNEKNFQFVHYKTEHKPITYMYSVSTASVDTTYTVNLTKYYLDLPSHIVISGYKKKIMYLYEKIKQST